MLDDLKPLSSALYGRCKSAPCPEFDAWRMFWIASNGNLGRKRAIDQAALRAAAASDREEMDAYAYLFAIESALCFVAAEILAACGGRTSDPWAASTFDWWKRDRHGNLRVLAASLSAQVQELSTTDMLNLLANDPFRGLYHSLLPKAIRHTLGAYLSPPDLCAYVLDSLNVEAIFDANRLRIIEPSCGLGAFFCALLTFGMKRVRSGKMSKADLGHVFQKQVYGVEKNLGSFVIAQALHQSIVAKLIGSSEPSANVIWADSVYVDEEYIARSIGSGLSLGSRIMAPGLLKVSTPADGALSAATLAEGKIREVFDGKRWRHSSQGVQRWSDTLAPCQRSLQVNAIEQTSALEHLGRFDFIVGNPPWVNWENLDPAYKELILPSWPPLGLFAMSGRDRAFSKEDLSVLATYTACLRFAKPGTKVGLLLPQSVFQSRKNSKGFRRFRLGQHGPFLKIGHVTDFSDYAAFGDAKNRTAALFCTVGMRPTTYPVPYLRFVSAGRGEALGTGTYKLLRASPSSIGDETSNWALYEETELPNTKKIPRGTYRARTGVFTGGANGVYYVRVLDDSDCTKVLVENDTERAKVKVRQQRLFIEPEFIYPFAKGRDLQQWMVNRPKENAIIMPHAIATKIRPLSPQAVQSVAPRTFAYLSQHEAMLRTRPSLTAIDRANVDEGFYALLRVGDYTFARYKVAWKYISRIFCCAVVGPSEVCNRVKPTILQEKLISIALEGELEAYYVCAYLSASSTRREIERRIVGTQVSVHVIEDIHIPEFDSKNNVHRRMALLCQEGHASDGMTPARLATLDALVGSLEPALTKTLPLPAEMAT